MTEICFYTDDAYVTGFEISGHSGYAKSGKDIVCAAVSALSINCVNSLEELLGIVPKVKEDQKRGYLEVIVEDYKRDDVQLLLRSLVIGLDRISEEYGNFVKLTNRRCTP